MILNDVVLVLAVVVLLVVLLVVDFGVLLVLFVCDIVVLDTVVVLRPGEVGGWIVDVLVVVVMGVVEGTEDFGRFIPLSVVLSTGATVSRIQSFSLVTLL